MEGLPDSVNFISVEQFGQIIVGSLILDLLDTNVFEIQ